jgi:hypothetical protein
MDRACSVRASNSEAVGTSFNATIFPSLSITARQSILKFLDLEILPFYIQRLIRTSTATTEGRQTTGDSKVEGLIIVVKQLANYAKVNAVSRIALKLSAGDLFASTHTHSGTRIKRPNYECWLVWLVTFQ